MLVSPLNDHIDVLQRRVGGDHGIGGNFIPIPNPTEDIIHKGANEMYSIVYVEIPQYEQ